ncbi:MAG TPA: histidine kinase, partial [Pyrinomonadaceae bacterium]
YLSSGFFQYVTIATIYQVYWHLREAQNREFRLQQAELQALKTQLHPHFLFNTLNAVSSLSFNAPEVASRVVAQLSDLLRFSLKTERAAEIALKEELDFVRKYLEIQQTLLDERLEIKWNIAPETLDACVPNMFLQPLVENSIRHGITPKEDGGWIEVISQREGEQLEISVKDNGLGISSNGNKTSGGGIGLSNTRARLQHLYGEAHKFQLSEPTEGGVLISMVIPFKTKKSD